MENCGGGIFEIRGKGNNEAKLNIGDGSTAILSREEGYAVGDVKINTAAMVVLGGENQIGGELIFGAGGGCLNLNGYDFSREQVHALNEDATIANFNQDRESTYTFSGKGSHTYAGSFADGLSTITEANPGGTNGSILNVAYLGSEKSSWTLTGISSIAGDFTARGGGQVTVQGIMLKHADGTDYAWQSGILSAGTLTIDGGTRLVAGTRGEISGALTIGNGGSFVVEREGNFTGSLLLQTGGYADLTAKTSLSADLTLDGGVLRLSIEQSYLDLGNHTLTLTGTNTFQLEAGNVFQTGSYLLLATGSINWQAGASIILSGGDVTSQQDYRQQFTVGTGTGGLEPSNNLYLYVTGQAADLVWSAAGTQGLWQWKGAVDSWIGALAGDNRFYSLDRVKFDGGGSSEILISGDVHPGAISVTDGVYHWKSDEANGGKITGRPTTLQMTGGDLTISLSNDYMGGTTLSGGILRLQSANALGEGAIHLQGGTLIAGKASYLNLDMLTLDGGTLDLTSNSEAALWKNVKGTGGSLLLGKTNLTLQTATNATGLFTVFGEKGSILKKTGAGNLDLGGIKTTGSVTLEGGALIIHSGGNIDGGVLMNPGTTLATGAELSDGDIIAIGGIMNLGLSGQNNYFFGVEGSRGTLSINEMWANWNVSIAARQNMLIDTYRQVTDRNTTLSVSSGATVKINNWGGHSNTNGGITQKQGKGELIICNLLNTGSAKAINIVEGTLSFDIAQGQEVIQGLEGIKTISSTGDAVGRALVKTGEGTLLLKGANTFTFDTILKEGTLAVGHLNGLGAVGSRNIRVDTAAPVTLEFQEGIAGALDSLTVEKGGHLHLAGKTSGFEGVGTAAVRIEEGSHLTLSSLGNQSFNGILSGSGNLSKTGAGNIQISSAADYSGTLHIGEGLLILTGDGRNMTGSIETSVGGSFQTTGDGGKFSFTLGTNDGLAHISQGELTILGNTGGTLTLDNGALLDIAGSAQTGSIHVNSLRMEAGTTLKFDIGSENEYDTLSLASFSLLGAGAINIDVNVYEGTLINREFLLIKGSGLDASWFNLMGGALTFASRDTVSGRMGEEGYYLHVLSSTPQSLTWTGADANTWKAGSSTWTGSQDGDNRYYLRDTVTFGEATGGLVLVEGAVNSSILATGGNHTLRGGADDFLTGETLTLQGGTLTLDIRGEFTQPISIMGGALGLLRGDALGSTSADISQGGQISLGYSGGFTNKITGTGTLLVQRGADITLTNNHEAFTGTIRVDGTLNIAKNAAQNYAGDIAGSGDVILTGSNAFTVNGTKTLANFSGNMEIREGSINWTGADFLTAGATLTFNSDKGGNLISYSNTGINHLFGAALDVRKNGTINLGGQAYGPGLGTTFANSISIAEGAMLTLFTDTQIHNFILSGNLSGSGSIYRKFGGTYFTVLNWLNFVLKGDNSAFSGTVGIQGSNFGSGVNSVARIQVENVLSANKSMTFDTGGTGNQLELNTGNQTTVTVGGLIGKGLVGVSNGTIVTLVMDTSIRGDSSFAGTLSGGLRGGINGAINGTGVLALVKDGEGQLTLSGANTYTGGTILKQGTLVAQHQTALGTGEVILEGGILSIAAGVLGNDITVTGNAALASTGQTDLGGKLTLHAGSRLDTGALTGSLTVGSLAVDGTATISGSLALKNTAAVLDFRSVDSHLTLGGNLDLGTGDLSILLGAGISAPGTYHFVSSTGISNFDASRITTLLSTTPSARATYTWSGDGGALSLQISGSAETLSWLGGSTGRWENTDNGAWTGALSGDNRFYEGDSVTFSSAHQGTVAIALEAGIDGVTVDGGTYTFTSENGGKLAGRGILLVTGQATTLNINLANTYAGETRVENGATLNAATAGGLGTSSLIVTGATASLTSSQTLTGVEIHQGGLVLLEGEGTLGSGKTAIQTGGELLIKGIARLNTVTSAGIALEGGKLALDIANTTTNAGAIAGKLAAGSTGTLELRNGVYQGSLALANNGYDIYIGSNAKFWSNAAASSQGVFTLNSMGCSAETSTEKKGGLKLLAGNIVGKLILAGESGVTNWLNETSTVNELHGGGNSFWKFNGGTLVINKLAGSLATLTVMRDTGQEGGSVLINEIAEGVTIGGIVLDRGYGFQLGGSVTQFGQTSVTSTNTAGTSFITLKQTGTLTLSDLVVGETSKRIKLNHDASAGDVRIENSTLNLSGIDKKGTSTLVLASQTNVSGATVINGGAIRIEEEGTLTGGGVITNNGILELAKNGDYTLDKQITGTGRLIQSGTGILTLTKNNTFSGGIEASSGIIKTTTATGFGTGLLVASGTGALDLNGFSLGNEIHILSGSADIINYGNYGGTLTLKASWKQKEILASKAHVAITNGGSYNLNGLAGNHTIRYERTDGQDGLASYENFTGNLIVEGDLRFSSTYHGQISIASGGYAGYANGAAATLSNSIAIDHGGSFLIESGAELTLSAAASISNNGALINKGTLYFASDLDATNQYYTGSGLFTNEGTINLGGNYTLSQLNAMLSGAALSGGGTILNFKADTQAAPDITGSITIAKTDSTGADTAVLGTVSGTLCIQQGIQASTGNIDGGTVIVGEGSSVHVTGETIDGKIEAGGGSVILGTSKIPQSISGTVSVNHHQAHNASLDILGETTLTQDASLQSGSITIRGVDSRLTEARLTDAADGTSTLENYRGTANITASNSHGGKTHFKNISFEDAHASLVIDSTITQALLDTLEGQGNTVQTSTSTIVTGTISDIKLVGLDSGGGITITLQSATISDQIGLTALTLGGEAAIANISGGLTYAVSPGVDILQNGLDLTALFLGTGTLNFDGNHLTLDLAAIAANSGDSFTVNFFSEQNLRTDQNEPASTLIVNLNGTQVTTSTNGWNVQGNTHTGQYTFTYDQSTPTPSVPEPSTFLLAALTLGGFALRRKRQQTTK